MRMDRMSGNALVIGGTGMLAEATDWVVRHSARTLLISRRASAAAKLMQKAEALDINWGDRSFESQVRQALHPLRPLSRVLLWLHDPNPILPWITPLLSPARVVLILGSMSGKPPIPASTWPHAIVQLGSMATAGGRRWLTHSEISEAAIAALRDGQSRVVGELRPAT